MSDLTNASETDMSSLSSDNESVVSRRTLFRHTALTALGTALGTASASFLTQKALAKTPYDAPSPFALAQEQTFTIPGGSGTKLFVSETGNPHGRPILFIHGYSQAHLSWIKQLNSELGATFRLVSLDLRGHGLSEKPEQGYTDGQLWADDIHAVIETLHLKRPVLCGWSLGGLVICDYLRHYGQRAIAGINFVAASTAIGTSQANQWLGANFLALVNGFFSQDALISAQGLESFVRLTTYQPIPLALFYLLLGYNTAVPPYVRRAIPTRIQENDDILRAITVPTLVTHGREDEVVLLAQSQHTASVVPHARTSYYPETGHSPFLEHPERFNQELAAFVESCSPS